MFEEDVMMDVIGCLEYNPNKPTPTRHREYLARSSQFREVIKFSSPSLLKKIHQTYK
jgi:protein phosphatase-4 regulatory subunit 3